MVRKGMTVAQLRKALEQLEPNDVVAVNVVDNLYVRRKNGNRLDYIGFIDFLDGNLYLQGDESDDE